VWKRKPKPDDQLILLPLPEQTSNFPRIEFDQSEHPVWTENKARLIEQYLYLFVLVTKHGTYIDGFAGPQRPGRLGMWSAKLVLDSEPHRLRNVFLFDSSRSQVNALCKLRKTQSSVKNRVIRIFHGDFNDRISRLLDKGQINRSEAIFCLLDQRTFECHWKTLERLSTYKGDGRPKIELFYFLAVRWLRRAITAIEKTEVLRNWWGRDDWEVLKDFTPDQIKDELVKRLKSELGYKSALPWAIYKRAGSRVLVYYMIHATDHPEAPKLMARAYNDAVQPRGHQLSFPGIRDPG
jgi:three-Cys-motif partner protein